MYIRTSCDSLSGLGGSYVAGLFMVLECAESSFGRQFSTLGFIAHSRTGTPKICGFFYRKHHFEPWTSYVNLESPRSGLPCLLKVLGHLLVLSKELGNTPYYNGKSNEKGMENKVDTLGPFKGVYRDITPIMENQMETNMENEM